MLALKDWSSYAALICSPASLKPREFIINNNKLYVLFYCEIHIFHNFHDHCTHLLAELPGSPVERISWSGSSALAPSCLWSFAIHTVARFLSWSELRSEIFPGPAAYRSNLSCPCLENSRRIILWKGSTRFSTSTYFYRRAVVRALLCSEFPI